VVAHAFNPSIWEAEAGGFLSSRLVYRVSSRTARATQRNPVSKNKKQTNKQKKPKQQQQNLGLKKKKKKKKKVGFDKKGVPCSFSFFLIRISSCSPG
jgi:hypothetical protein